jgi:hypothetical protein
MQSSDYISDAAIKKEPGTFLDADFKKISDVNQSVGAMCEIFLASKLRSQY